MSDGDAGSAAETLPRTGSGSSDETLDAVLARYAAELTRQGLAGSTRRAYVSKVRQFLVWLAGSALDFGDPLTDDDARNYAARDFKAHLKTRRLAPATVNQALAAVDSYYRYLGMGGPVVTREQLAAEAPRALDADEKRRLLRAVEQRGRPRDRALVAIGLFAGLRLAELVALDVADVPMSARKGQVIVRRGKGDAHRQVPLHAEARAALEAWLRVRRSWPGADTPALFLSNVGKRLGVRSVDLILDQLGQAARVEHFSAHVLRHTFCTELIRAGVDVVLVAELAGHRRLETTRRYSLPTAADRQAAVEGLTADY